MSISVTQNKRGEYVYKMESSYSDVDVFVMMLMLMADVMIIMII